MKKEQFIEILDYGIIDLENKEQLESLLELTEEKVDILLNNNGDKKALFSILTYFKNISQSKHIFDWLLKKDTCDEMNLILELAQVLNINVYKNLKTVKKYSNNIKNLEILQEYVKLALDKEIFGLECEIYDRVLALASQINNLELMKKYAKLTIEISSETYLDDYLTTLSKLKKQDIEKVLDFFSKCKEADFFILEALVYIEAKHLQSDSESLNKYIYEISKRCDEKIEIKFIDNDDFDHKIQNTNNSILLVDVINKYPDRVFRILEYIDSDTDINITTKVIRKS